MFKMKKSTKHLVYKWKTVKTLLTLHHIHATIENKLKNT